MIAARRSLLQTTSRKIYCRPPITRTFLKQSFEEEHMNENIDGWYGRDASSRDKNIENISVIYDHRTTTLQQYVMNDSMAVMGHDQVSTAPDDA
jgi:hypothetical protein